MVKPTFNMAVRKGETLATTYTPIIYTRGHEAWRLALHREPVLAGKGDWLISDPVSGYRVARVTATHKGVPVSSRHLTVTQARAAALVDLDITVDRIGLDRFARVLNQAQTKKEN